MSADDGVDVVLYGATGYTGRLAARELDGSGRSFALAGRDRPRLERLSAELDDRPPVVVADVNDAAALEAMARRGRAVISAAGPYVDLGPPVVEACLEAGSHFLDVAGEQTFFRWAAEQHERAIDAGITVVNGMGFDVVPSDIAALVASTAMRRVVWLDLAIRSNARPSGGTRRTMAASAGQGCWYHKGSFRRAPPGRFRRDFAFPAPIGAQPAIFVPWGDVATAPRSTGAETVRTFFVSKPKVVRRMHRLWPLTALAERTGVARRALARRARPTGEGPTSEQRARSHFAILAEAVDDEGVRQRGYVTGRDPYGLTGAAVVHGAGLLLDQGTSKGVLTPTQAFTFGPFVAAMERFDMEWRARSLEG